jgi:hypothetical protein
MLKQSKEKSKKIKFYNLQEPEIPSPSLYLLGKNIFDFILYKLKNIRHSELENTLNNIPYSYFQILLFYLEFYIRNVSHSISNCIPITLYLNYLEH